MLAAIVGIACFSGVGGCRADRGGSDRVDILSGPHSTGIVMTVKDGMPFVLFDVFPEQSAMAALSEEGKQEYLLKRVLVVLAEKGLSEPQFEGRREFRVRIVSVSSRDEYGRPHWAAASEIAQLEVSRDRVEGLDAASVAALRPSDARQRFRSVRIELANLSESRS